jgi:hypothetical protein
MLNKYIAVSLFLAIILVGNLSLAPTVWAENLVQSTVETRLVVALRVGQPEVQKLVPAPWQVDPPPAGPLKDANFMFVFIDQFLVQDPQGKPDMGGINRYVVLSVPVKHTQTGEMAPLVTGGFTPDIRNVPGAYKTATQSTVKRELTNKGNNIEPGVADDFWEVRKPRGGSIELRVQYQQALPLRAKSEQKVYSGVEPSFFRIYRSETATDVLKSIPANINRVQNYQLRVTMPGLKNLFDGSEQLVGIVAYPLFLRQIFLP